MMFKKAVPKKENLSQKAPKTPFNLKVVAFLKQIAFKINLKWLILYTFNYFRPFLSNYRSISTIYHFQSICLKILVGWDKNLKYPIISTHTVA